MKLIKQNTTELTEAIELAFEAWNNGATDIAICFNQWLPRYDLTWLAPFSPVSPNWENSVISVLTNGNQSFGFSPCRIECTNFAFEQSNR